MHFELPIAGFRIVELAVAPQHNIYTMKLLFKVIACVAILLPLTASAANFGDFRVGQKFSLTVTKITSTKRIGYFGTETKATIPTSLPKYRRSSLVAFTIGKNGRLTANDLSIPFAHASPTANEYNFYKSGTLSVTHNAEIIKNAAKKPVGGTLSFFINDFRGAEPIFRTVTYKLE